MEKDNNVEINWEALIAISCMTILGALLWIGIIYSFY